MRQIFSLTFRDLLILFLEQIKYGFFFLLKTRWQKKQKERGEFSSYKCVRYHHGAAIYILFLVI